MAESRFDQGKTLLESNALARERITSVIIEALKGQSQSYYRHDTDANGRNEIEVKVGEITVYITIE